MKKINILNINLIGWRTWSANVMNNISEWLDKNIFEYNTIVWYDFWNDEKTKWIYKTNNSFLYKNLRYKWFVWLNFLFDIMTFDSINMKYLKNLPNYNNIDIIHIHSIQWWYFNWNILPILSKEKKIIITLHDDWIVSWNDKNNLFFPYKTKSSYIRRKSIFVNSEIQYIWVSNWVTNKIQNDEIIWSNDVKTIYNWIDTSIFYKKDKNNSREKLNLQKDKKIIISIAWSWNKSNLKWLQFIKNIIKKYSLNNNFLFITIWNHKENKISDNFWELWWINHNIMSDYFSSADLFLYPSLADSFWLVVAECLACNCPILTFDTWGIPEITKHLKDWYIAQFKDMNDLEKWFEYIFNNYDTLTPSLEEKFNQNYMIKKYDILYNKLIKRW